MAAVRHDAPADTNFVPATRATLLTSPSSTIQSQGVEAFKDVTFGSIAGILAKYVEYPFDTVKVRLQSQSLSPLSNTRPHGPLDAFVAAWRSPEGPIRNLYRGISAPLVGAAIETSSLFFSYRIGQDLLVSIAPYFRARTVVHGKLDLPLHGLAACG